MRPVLLLGEGGLNYPLSLLYTDSPASARALQLATLLTERQGSTLHLLFAADFDLPQLQRRRAAGQLSQRLIAQDIQVETEVLDAETDLFDAIHAIDHGTLILPADHADLLDRFSPSVFLVP